MTASVREVAEWGDDVAYVAEHMRGYDVAELHCISRSDPWQALQQGLDISQETYVGSWNGTPATVFGCHTSVIGLHGVPWLLGTDALTDHPIPFLRVAKKYVAHLKARHTLLENVVHSQNKPSVVFLEALGFELLEPYQLANGAVVRKFKMKGDLDV